VGEGGGRGAELEEVEMARYRAREDGRSYSQVRIYASQLDQAVSTVRSLILVAEYWTKTYDYVRLLSCLSVVSRSYLMLGAQRR